MCAGKYFEINASRNGLKNRYQICDFFILCVLMYNFSFFISIFTCVLKVTYLHIPQGSVYMFGGMLRDGGVTSQLWRFTPTPTPRWTLIGGQGVNRRRPTRGQVSPGESGEKEHRRGLRHSDDEIFGNGDVNDGVVNGDIDDGVTVNGNDRNFDDDLFYSSAVTSNNGKEQVTDVPDENQHLGGDENISNIKGANSSPLSVTLLNPKKLLSLHSQQSLVDVGSPSADSISNGVDNVSKGVESARKVVPGGGNVDSSSSNSDGDGWGQLFSNNGDEGRNRWFPSSSSFGDNNLTNTNFRPNTVLNLSNAPEETQLNVVDEGVRVINRRSAQAAKQGSSVSSSTPENGDKSSGGIEDDPTASASGRNGHQNGGECGRRGRRGGGNIAGTGAVLCPPVGVVGAAAVLLPPEQQQDSETGVAVMLVLFGYSPEFGFINTVQEYNLGEFTPP